MRNRDYLNRIAMWESQRQNGQIMQGEFEGLRREWNTTHAQFMVIIKTLPETPFRFVIDAMDEIQMTGVSRRVIQEMTQEEAGRLNPGAI
jgi:hypothetical protein